MSRARLALVAGVCALVVALVAGALAVDTGGTDHTKRVTTTLRPGTWERIPFAATGFETDASVAAIVRSGPGYVAVGSVRAADVATTSLLTDVAGAVWTSADGRHWRRAPLPASTPPLGSLVATRRGLFALGTPFANGSPPSTVLHSDDGAHWDVVTTTGPAGVVDVVAGGPGLVAAGSEMVDAQPHPAIWSSTDGRTWTRAEGVGSGIPRGSIVGIAARAGTLVAVGSEYTTSLPPRLTSLTWVSTDGVHWAVHRDPLHGGTTESVAASEDGFLIDGIQLAAKGSASTTTTTTTRAPVAPFRPNRACGSTSSYLTETAAGAYQATWTSTDGRDWKAGAPPTSPLAGSRPLFAAHGWWIAGGTTGDPTNGMGAAAWVSADGVTWSTGFTEDAPPPGPCSPRSLSVQAGVATDRGALLVVGAWIPFDANPPIGPDLWIWTPPAAR